ncbi:MAG TPA: GlsB/YeaQ/YmgE family stress response membrane protein [Candidatus Binataceae bacterium]|nr:GlsB/YeaQ/YmgE family stress response membrane protein [Candidatus Binataceae bacterium]
MLGSIFVGLIAGWLAGQLIRGGGYGMIADILLGMVGGVIGGWLFGTVGVHPHHLFGAVMVSTVGAIALVLSTRIVLDEM